NGGKRCTIKLPCLFEHYKNKKGIKRAQPTGRAPGCRRAAIAVKSVPLRLGHPARYSVVVRPVAIKPHDAPFHAPRRPDDPGALGDGIVNGVPAAVGNLDLPAAEPAWDGIHRPGAIRRLANFLEREDLEVRVPEAVFPVVEAR